jgi:hypothetical protein
MENNKRRILRRLALCAGLAVAGSATAGFQDMLKSAEGLLGGSGTAGGQSTAASAAGLSDAQIGAGLKQALSLGAERAVALLGRDGGFLDDPSVRIGLPGSLDTLAQGLRAAGQGKYVDEFELAVNRAAEEAVPATLDIVRGTVESMSLDDVRGILTGGDDAATRFLQERAGDRIHGAVLPIVTRTTDQVGVTRAYKAMVDQAGGAVGGLGSGLGAGLGSLGGLGGLVDTGSLDLDRYVTDQTLDGLFKKLAAEEKKIREDPVARSTELLQTVFGG